MLFTTPPISLPSLLWSPAPPKLALHPHIVRQYLFPLYKPMDKDEEEEEEKEKDEGKKPFSQQEQSPQVGRIHVFMQTKAEEVEEGKEEDEVEEGKEEDEEEASETLQQERHKSTMEEEVEEKDEGWGDTERGDQYSALLKEVRKRRRRRRRRRMRYY